MAGLRNTEDKKIGDRKMGARNIFILLSKRREFGFPEKNSITADG